ncbi:MAG: ABC transporter permease [Nitrososphaerota archaeon]|nr:ABC transporter permease [Nitrososphaerota archaeon]
MNIGSFIIRRLLLAIFVLIGVATITFILSHSLGGNPLYAWLGKSVGLHPQLAQAYAEKYHLNDPIYIQYYYYLSGLLHGSLGYSPSRGFVPVISVISETLPYTLQIVFFAIIISIILGVALGVVAARYHHKLPDKSIRGFYLAGIASPSFFIALVLLIAFTFELRLLPSGGAANPLLTLPRPITHLPLLDSLLEGNWPYFVSALKHVILPSMALALVTFGVIVRVLRSSMLDVMRSNYVRTARAKGLSENTVFFKHGLRNAMISVVTLSSLILTWLITGTIFVENIFAYPGMGQYVYQALLAQDYPGIMATTLVFAIIIIVTNLVADILYAVVDPQIRLA